MKMDSLFLVLTERVTCVFWQTSLPPLTPPKKKLWNSCHGQTHRNPVTWGSQVKVVFEGTGFYEDSVMVSIRTELYKRDNYSFFFCKAWFRKLKNDRIFLSFQVRCLFFLSFSSTFIRAGLLLIFLHLPRETALIFCLIFLLPGQ